MGGLLQFDHRLHGPLLYLRELEWKHCPGDSPRVRAAAAQMTLTAAREAERAAVSNKPTTAASPKRNGHWKDGDRQAVCTGEGHAGERRAHPQIIRGSL